MAFSFLEHLGLLHRTRAPGQGWVGMSPFPGLTHQAVPLLRHLVSAILICEDPVSGLCPYSPLYPEYPLPIALAFSDIPLHALSTCVDWHWDILASGSCSSAHSPAEGQNRVKLVTWTPELLELLRVLWFPVLGLGTGAAARSGGLTPINLCNKLWALEIGVMSSWKHGYGSEHSVCMCVCVFYLNLILFLLLLLWEWCVCMSVCTQYTYSYSYSGIHMKGTEDIFWGLLLFSHCVMQGSNSAHPFQ